MNEPAVSPFVEALFGGTLIAKTGGGMFAIPDCASDQNVNQNNLAAVMFAYAFLTMREAGQIELNVAKKRVLFINHTYVQVRRTNAPAPTEPLLAQIYAKIVDGKSVYDTIYDWCEKDVANPYATIVQTATREAVRAGYLQETQPQGFGGKLASLLKSTIPTTRVNEKRADLENIRRAAAQKWQSFKLKDAQLVEEVLTQCRRALTARTESSDGSSGVT